MRSSVALTVTLTPDDFLSKEAFDAIQNFIITKPELQGRLITVNAFGLKFVGCPVCIDNPKYKRNALIFNLNFVFSESTNTASYGAVVKKLAGYMIQLEMENGFLSNEDKVSPILEFLEQVRHDLNSNGVCNIAMGESCTVHLKVMPQTGEKMVVQDHDVPILTVPRHSIIMNPWDLTTQQILRHVDGTSHVTRIAAEADVDINLVKACLQNLLYFKAVKMLCVFQYSNVYTCTPEIHRLVEDKNMQLECLQYVARNDHSLPSFRDVFMLYCSLTPGTTVKDLCTRFNPHNLKVDEKHLVQFGLLKGLIRRLQKYPVKLPNEIVAPRLQPILKWLNGSHSYDEISSKSGMSHLQLEELIETDPSCVVCLK
ncbi:GATOR complex protein NPRL2-like isoform X2 [Pomacea canaliculata]|uniref:GATOR complex protein NPRL2-like isoform X2 n=1 Tax=Pomacea canaliculata TaxID=400727 RepID=UPI000D73EA11|nr:GATOR complex protein NPRL2-like isoform X2 [Pomacea canaliculata]